MAEPPVADDGRERGVARSPLAHTGPAVALGLALAALLVVRPWLHGIGPGASLRFWAFVLLYVLVPGVLLVRALGLAHRDLALLLGLGGSIGITVEGVFFFLSRALGRTVLFDWFPLPFLLLWLVRGQSREADLARTTPTTATTLGLPLVALAALALTPLASVPQFERPLAPDMLFHTANAAELRYRWPPADPRVAGEPLNYHLFGSGLPAAAAQWSGLRTGDVTLGLLPLLAVGLLALELANLGRVATGSSVAGLVGAALFLLYRDPGRWLGWPQLATYNELPTGIYGSVSTSLGFVLLASLGTTLALWLQRPSARGLLPVVLLAFAVSGTKGSVLPAVVVGLALCVAWQAWRRDRVAATRTAVALLAVGLAGAPLTLRLAFGPGTYRGMFAVDPLATARLSPLLDSARIYLFGLTEPLPSWATLALSPVWLVAYLGAPFLAALCLLASPPARAKPLVPWLVFTSAAGMALALTVAAVDQSQLFFAYTGQLTLCVLGGAGVAAAGASHRRLVLAVGLLAVPGLLGSVRAMGSVVRDDDAAALYRPAAPARDYVAGLDWLRQSTPPDAVLLSTDRSQLLSAFGERRAFYETGHFTTRGHALEAQGDPDPFPERTRAGRMFFAHPSADALAGVRRILPPGTEILVVLDEVRFRFEAGLLVSQARPVEPPPLLPPEAFDLVFANPAVQVYRPR